MSAPARQPKEIPPESSPKDRPRKRHQHKPHPTLLGKLGHAGFRFSKHTLEIFGILVGLVLLVIIASFFVDEPMRRAMEKKMNDRLTGYTVRIRDLDFRLLTWAITLHDLSIRQDAHPDPPVALIPRLRASVQWSELITFHLVADFQIDQPQVYLNLAQLRKEDSDAVPVHKRGWQEAAEAIYPLKINLFQINDGAFTYIDQDPKRPLGVTHLFIRANNIRNIRSPDRVYPSPVHAEAVVFDTGRAEIDGHANFLAEPHLGLNTLFSVESIPLDYFRPVLSRVANLSVRNGTLSSNGRIEYAPAFKIAHVEDLLIDRVRLDYVYSGSRVQERRVDKVQKTVKTASNKPGLLLRLDQFRLSNSNVGLVNRAKEPGYRVYLSGTNLRVTNLSNQFREGPARATLSGRFMGSGRTSARATFRPEKTGPDFDLDAKIEGTQAATMNDIWRTYGKFDVTGGTFSLFSEVRVKNGYLNGYVKPLFADLNVYDPKQDEKKGFFKKIYEKIVEEVGDLLENEEREEVVTVARISGPVSDPDSSAWQIIGKLIENAFVDAILPGFEREVGLARKRR